MVSQTSTLKLGSGIWTTTGTLVQQFTNQVFIDNLLRTLWHNPDNGIAYPTLNLGNLQKVWNQFKKVATKLISNRP